MRRGSALRARLPSTCPGRLARCQGMTSDLPCLSGGTAALARRAPSREPRRHLCPPEPPCAGLPWAGAPLQPASAASGGPDRQAAWVGGSAHLAPRPAEAAWSAWGMWGACSKSCGPGRRLRRRSCQGSSGDTCPGSSQEAQKCVRSRCPGRRSRARRGHGQGRGPHEEEPRGC